MKSLLSYHAFIFLIDSFIADTAWCRWGHLHTHIKKPTGFVQMRTFHTHIKKAY